MTPISNRLRIFFHVVLFTVLMICCYCFIDDHLTLHTQHLRSSLYIPLRILSILISPPTQLVIWTSLFLWFLIIKKSQKISHTLYPMVASLILTNALVRIVKVFFGRSRPDMLLTDGIYHLKIISFQRIFSSLPSGHAATLAAIMGFLAARHPRYALLYILGSILLSLCRVFIGAHYLTDILVGNFLGFYVSWMIYFEESLDEPIYLEYTKKEPTYDSLSFHSQTD
ncbi:MAG: phosphatase PAP2 family protein [Chlamydiae bacterium]|nr:phosphatase PAP2 family protein [Chlamydiota bacterium]